MTPTVIRTENLSKSYRIGVWRDAEATLRDAIADGARGAAARLTRSGSAARRARGLFWALDDVSVDIHQGDIVGIIGRNGAGKSTLLKILSRITEPTSGRARIRGRIGSLLEVGTGFHPELSGRENVFLNGSILGMRRAEIARRFDEIVEFAEIGEHLDTPVKRYSSGMQVRLAFSVAAHLEPEILLVDEVLAVGDVAFQKKCLGRMDDVARAGRTVLFVSHNMAVMHALCKRGIFLDHGKLRFDGSIDEAVSLYLRDLEQAMSTDLTDRRDRKGAGEVRLTRVDISGADGDGYLSSGRAAVFEFHVSDVRPGTMCAFTVFSGLGHPVSEFRTALTAPDDATAAAPDGRIRCVIEELPLVPGRYRIDAELTTGGRLQDAVESAVMFDVEEGLLGGRPVSSDGRRGDIAVRHRWILPKD